MEKIMSNSSGDDRNWVIELLRDGERANWKEGTREKTKSMTKLFDSRYSVMYACFDEQCLKAPENPILLNPVQ